MPLPLDITADRNLFLGLCAEHGYHVPEDKLEKIDIYISTLLKWQKNINLIGPQTIQQPYTRHVLDSFQLLPHIPEKSNVIDFGSGGGMPAIPLAIMKNCSVTAVERNGKKYQFLQEVKRVCGLSSNLTIKNCDIRALAEEETKYNVVTARAFAELQDIISLALPITVPDVKFVLLKGARIMEEILITNKTFRMTYTLKNSITNSEGKVLLINTVSRETE